MYSIVLTPPKKEKRYLFSPTVTKSAACSFKIEQTALPAKSVTVQSIGNPSNRISFTLALMNIDSGFWKMLLIALPKKKTCYFLKLKIFR